MRNLAIVLDIGLPVMNGYAVARALRDLPELSHVYIAAVTGWGQEEDRRQSRDAGFDSHFTKPLAPAVLQDVLDTVAQRIVSGRGRGQHDRTPVTRIRVPRADLASPSLTQIASDGGLPSAPVVPTACLPILRDAFAE